MSSFLIFNLFLSMNWITILVVFLLRLFFIVLFLFLVFVMLFLFFFVMLRTFIFVMVFFFSLLLRLLLVFLVLFLLIFTFFLVILLLFIIIYVFIKSIFQEKLDDDRTEVIKVNALILRFVTSKWQQFLELTFFIFLALVELSED
mmetsp:Transcript_52597/g.72094  ORF Transcript_52597/g.72094 Transcript_52597/m.72094 type:complete len:145 (-) Transcript_52597:1002-1436(-)